MPDDLDLVRIRRRWVLAEAALGETTVHMHIGASVRDVPDLIGEVERLRTERDHWREAAQHLSRERGEEGPPAPG